MSHGLFRLYWARWGGPDRTLRTRPLKRPTHTLVKIRLLVIGSSLTLHSSFLWLSLSDACGSWWLRPWIILLWQKIWYWALVTPGTFFSGCSDQFARFHQAFVKDEAQLQTRLSLTLCLAENRLTVALVLWGSRANVQISIPYLFHLWLFKVHS